MLLTWIGSTSGVAVSYLQVMPGLLTIATRKAWGADHAESAQASEHVKIRLRKLQPWYITALVLVSKWFPSR